MDQQKITELVIQAISEKKGHDIEVYDTTSLTPFMDTMIVASSDNLKQNYALAQNIKDRLFEAGYDGNYRVEGTSESRWILVDLKDIVIHLFADHEREVYSLDRLYQECPVQRFE
ncbi:MAG: ribosome silencing factor [Allobaculum sp.]|nr:ribosome silencing factor [Allobaculum sp.]